MPPCSRVSNREENCFRRNALTHHTQQPKSTRKDEELAAWRLSPLAHDPHHPPSTLRSARATMLLSCIMPQLAAFERYEMETEAPRGHRPVYANAASRVFTQMASIRPFIFSTSSVFPRPWWYGIWALSLSTFFWSFL